jgi:two-component system alkaline phosphatase synthesis response regulator PhoP
VSGIYVVDDEPDVVDLVRTILVAAGHEVRVATDGGTALAEIIAAPPDLVVLDLMMPDLDGFELLRLLRVHPATAEVPIVILSARTAPVDQLETLKLGANAYLCKPFSPRELLRQLRQLLAERPESVHA